MRRDAFGQIVDEIKRASKKSLDLYLNPPNERDRPHVQLAIRKPSSAPAKCSFCQEYLIAGSTRLRRCLSCGIPLLSDED